MVFRWDRANVSCLLELCARIRVGHAVKSETMCWGLVPVDRSCRCDPAPAFSRSTGLTPASSVPSDATQMCLTERRRVLQTVPECSIESDVRCPDQRPHERLPVRKRRDGQEQRTDVTVRKVVDDGADPWTSEVPDEADVWNEEQGRECDPRVLKVRVKVHFDAKYREALHPQQQTNRAAGKAGHSSTVHDARMVLVGVAGLALLWTQSAGVR